VASVEFEGASHPGHVAEATFVIPEVSLGVYYLAESIEAEGSGCHVFAPVGIGVDLPDTAIGRPTTLTVAGLVAMALSILLIGRARRAHS
jgi:hypothetical protein